MELPEELVENPDWTDARFDDVSTLGEPSYVQLSCMGFRSLLSVAVRVEGRLVGALMFLSTARSAFSHADVHVADRIADRMAATLARDRDREAALQRADEAAARASKLEARVRALTEELDVRTGYRDRKSVV